MPEFILDHGDVASAKQFAALDSFTQGYIEAMFFTDTEPNTVRPDDDSDYDDCNVWNPEKHSSLPGDVSVADLAAETLARIVADCDAWRAALPRDSHGRTYLDFMPIRLTPTDTSARE